MPDRPHILIYATSPLATSGYANANRYVAPRLWDAGFEVTCFAWNTQRQTEIVWERGIHLIPGGDTLTSVDVLAGHIQHFGVDVVLSIVDPWIIAPGDWRAGHSARIVHWHPCQGDPPGAALLNAVRSADIGLNYSRWGTQVMRQSGAGNVRYVPLGVDRSVFHPEDRGEARAFMAENVLKRGLGDAPLVVTVSANSSTLPIMRKGFDQQALAFARLKRTHPDAVWYIHTKGDGLPGGFNLDPLMRAVGLVPGRDVYYANPYAYTRGLDDSWMARVYNAADIVSNASLGEGFGLPILEAQACGVPVVTTNWSAMPELTAYGHVADVAALQWVPGTMEQFCAVPSADSIAEGYLGILAGAPSRGNREAALALADSLSYDRVVTDYLLPALAEVGIVPVPRETDAGRDEDEGDEGRVALD